MDNLARLLEVLTQLNMVQLRLVLKFAEFLTSREVLI